MSGGENPVENDDSAGDVMTFDSSLPVRHSYLGSNLEELQGRTVLDDWSFHTLPLLPVSSVVLVPGQTLPLNEVLTPAVDMLKRCIETDHLFGSVALLKSKNSIGITAKRLADVGTVAEINECHYDTRGESLCVKAIGRQRFRVVSFKKEPFGLIKGKVQILPEIILPDPMSEIRLCSLDRFRSDIDDGGDVEKMRYLFRQDAVTSQWPSWVYSQFRASDLITRIKEIFDMDTLTCGLNIPSDPAAFSFWLIKTIPLEDEQKLAMLKLNSAILRLQYVLKIYKKCAVVCCANCRSPLADPRDIFSMSVEGARGAYVNAGGFIHDIITVNDIKNIELRGPDSKEFSWFPGYAWRIAHCGQCMDHIGWRFSAVIPKLKPSTFWALTNKSIAYGHTRGEGEKDEVDC